MMQFTIELGETIRGLIYQKNWKVCYEWRNHGDDSKYQSIEEVFSQESNSLEIGPRYYVLPGPLTFDEFSLAFVKQQLQIPIVLIEGEKRFLFGFGLRQDDCFFVTNDTMHGPTADREPKSYEFMLEALHELEYFVTSTAS